MQGQEGATGIWKYSGTPYYWNALDDNAASAYTMAYENYLYEVHNDSSIWYYGGSTNDWIELDNNPQTFLINEAMPLRRPRIRAMPMSTSPKVTR